MATIPRNAAAARKAAPARIRGKILVLHGPNLNLLGTREPAVYGRATLADINARLAAQAKTGGVAFAAFQNNHEGAPIDRVHAAVAEGVGFIVINPAGLGAKGYELALACAVKHLTG
jgi:3-dehydroquinate dehydratase-2